MACAAGWWYKPDFIINDININSAVTSPAHDEVITLAEGNSHVSIAGYAYSGDHPSIYLHSAVPHPACYPLRWLSTYLGSCQCTNAAKEPSGVQSNGEKKGPCSLLHLHMGIQSAGL